MKKLIIFFLVLINISLFVGLMYAGTTNNANQNISSNLIIKLPLKLNWGLSPIKVARMLRIKLKLKNGKWLKYDKDGIRYWFYFEASKKLKQITVLFKRPSKFSVFMGDFSSKYKDLRIKTNLYQDNFTTVAVMASIRSKVVFLKK